MSRGINVASLYSISAASLGAPSQLRRYVLLTGITEITLHQPTEFYNNKHAGLLLNYNAPCMYTRQVQDADYSADTNRVPKSHETLMFGVQIDVNLLLA